jgi:hypothetical protein
LYDGQTGETLAQPQIKNGKMLDSVFDAQHFAELYKKFHSGVGRCNADPCPADLADRAMIEARSQPRI